MLSFPTLSELPHIGTTGSPDAGPLSLPGAGSALSRQLGGFGEFRAPSTIIILFLDLRISKNSKEKHPRQRFGEVQSSPRCIFSCALLDSSGLATILQRYTIHRFFQQAQDSPTLAFSLALLALKRPPQAFRAGHNPQLFWALQVSPNCIFAFAALYRRLPDAAPI